MNRLHRFSTILAFAAVLLGMGMIANAQNSLLLSQNTFTFNAPAGATAQGTPSPSVGYTRHEGGVWRKRMRSRLSQVQPDRFEAPSGAAILDRFHPLVRRWFIGRFGAELMPQNGQVMTQCNAGALATAGIGTALGVFSMLAQKERSDGMPMSSA